MKISISLTLLLGLAVAPAAASATDDGEEIWLNPSISFDLDDETGIEFETAQRIRNADDGRPDTYFARLWISQKVAKNVTLSGAIERRINDGGFNKTRLIQQLSTNHGYFRTRLRLEQRVVDDAYRAGCASVPDLAFPYQSTQTSRGGSRQMQNFSSPISAKVMAVTKGSPALGHRLVSLTRPATTLHLALPACASKILMPVAPTG